MELIIIAAASENDVIGINNRLPWRIPEDMQRFKELTSGHAVIMGRKTYESLPGTYRPLPQRLNVVLSTQQNYAPLGVQVAHSLEEALHDLQTQKVSMDGITSSDAFIIGGERVFREAFQLTDRIELTRIHKTIGGDAFFPYIDPREWQVQQRMPREDYSFVTYVKISLPELSNHGG